MLYVLVYFKAAVFLHQWSGYIILCFSCIPNYYSYNGESIRSAQYMSIYICIAGLYSCICVDVCMYVYVYRARVLRQQLQFDSVQVISNEIYWLGKKCTFG